jgi:hypothetical protein
MRLQSQAFVGQALGQVSQATAQRRLGQSPIYDITLGVAAAEAVCYEARRM